MNSQRLQISELNEKLCEKDHYVEYFNLNPLDIFKSLTCTESININEALSNVTVMKILNDSKQFLIKWANAYANAIFGSTIEYPDIIRFMAVCAKTTMKERFHTASDELIMQAVGAWLFKSCWERAIVAVRLEKEELNNENSSLPIRKLIAKFIEYAILNYGYGIEKHWLNSLNATIVQINSLSRQHFCKCVLQNPPAYKYDIQDEYVDKYGPRRPVLHIAMHHLQITHQRFQDNVDEVLPDKNSKLRKMIVSTVAPDDKMQYVTLYLQPLEASCETEKNEDLLRSTVRYVEQCILSGCTGNSLTQILAHHTLQKEEDIFRSLPHQSDDQPTLDDTKRQIIRQLSALEAAGCVTSMNNYQNIILAVAKDISWKHCYRRNRQVDLANANQLIKKLENARLKIYNQLEAFDEMLETIKKQEELIQSHDNADKGEKMWKVETYRMRNSVKNLINSGIVIADPSSNCSHDMMLEISTTNQAGILMFKILEPSKQVTYQTELELQQLSDAAAKDQNETTIIANKLTVNVQKLIAYINQTNLS